MRREDWERASKGNSMIDKEVVVSSGRRLPMGEDLWEIRDHGAPIHYADLVTEVRHHNTVIYLSLGQAISDNGNRPIAQIATRLRLDIGTAKMLHEQLGETINEAAGQQAIDGSEEETRPKLSWIRPRS